MVFYKLGPPPKEEKQNEREEATPITMSGGTQNSCPDPLLGHTLGHGLGRAGTQGPQMIPQLFQSRKAVGACSLLLTIPSLLSVTTRMNSTSQALLQKLHKNQLVPRGARLPTQGLTVRASSLLPVSVECRVSWVPAGGGR